MEISQNGPQALLIIDMLNTLEFPEWKLLLKNARPTAMAILKLKQRAKRLKIPVIYVNDNFGQWRASWQDVYTACEKSRGKELAKLLKPAHDDYFVLKPAHSGFYSTPLELLLKNLRAKKLILTGIAGNICVLFTANDAYMRGFEVYVPEDCIASNRKSDTTYTVRQLRDVFGINTTVSTRLKLTKNS
jgi:nicotinamidase-related amidase